MEPLRGGETQSRGGATEGWRDPELGSLSAGWLWDPRKSTPTCRMTGCSGSECLTASSTELSPRECFERKGILSGVGH